MFAVQISIGKTQQGEDKNEVKTVITPDHPRYYEFMPKQNAPQSTVATGFIDDSIPFEV